MNDYNWWAPDYDFNSLTYRNVGLVAEVSFSLRIPLTQGDTYDRAAARALQYMARAFVTGDGTMGDAAKRGGFTVNVTANRF